MQPIWSLGLMSGTSADGIDAALVYTDGHQILDFGPTLSVPYSQEFQNRLKSCYGHSDYPPAIQLIAEELTHLHEGAVSLLLKQHHAPVSLIGFHGQTIFHAPPRTRQIGNSALLALLTGIPVIGDFRLHDVEKGGQGAPLVPLFHQTLVQGLEPPTVVINIGGVSNLTYCGDSLIGFDTGPGNGLIDDWVYHKTGAPYDDQGKLAAQGHVQDDVLKKWLTHPYFLRPYPKSLDRNDFMFTLQDIAFFSPADGAATLTAFTAQTLYYACCQLPVFPKSVFLCGGGRLNHFLVDYLQRLFLNCPVKKIEDLELRGDMIEAQAFAFLAVRSFYNLPYTFPLTTGAPYPLTGGTLYKVGEN